MMVKTVKVVLWFGRLTLFLMTVQYPAVIVVGKGLIHVIAMSGLSILEGTILRMSLDHVSKGLNEPLRSGVFFMNHKW